MSPSHSETRYETATRGDRIDVKIDGKLFTSYRYPSDWKFPYLWPVNGPVSGESLTIEKGIRYPHHRSLYFACGKVNGGNYWQEGLDRGRIVSEGPQVIESGTRVVIEDTCRWISEGRPSPIRDHRRITIRAASSDVRLIEFQIELDFLIDTHIPRTNHSLFSAEVVPELSVEGGGEIVNSSGEINEKGTWGKKAVWCDYHGERDGVHEGIAILQHPGNPGFPWPYFTRNYGFFSPTPLYWIGEEGLDFKGGDKVTLKFLVVVHEGAPQKEELDRILEKWVGEPDSRRTP